MTATPPIPDRIQDLDFNSTTRDPIATDDTNAGYYVGSIWVNTSTGNSFMCTDATASAAVWLVLSTIGRAAAGTDAAGTNLDVTAGRGTGAGIPGILTFKYPILGGSGSTLQTLGTSFVISPLPPYPGAVIFAKEVQFLATVIFSAGITPISVDSATFVKAGTFMRFPAGTELTIASGAVTATKSHHTIDTEGDAASDNLDTISGLSNGDVIIIRPSNSARTVVVKHGTGNIKTFSGSDITLNSSDKAIMLVHDGTNLLVLGP